MRKVDRLSRRLDQKVEVEKYNDNQVFIKDCWLHSLHEVVIEGLEEDIIKKIKKARDKDKKIVRVVEEIKKVGVKVLRGEEWQLEGDLVLKEGKMYVLKNEELRVEIIWLYHNMPVAEHGGKQKMTELVTRNYQWPGVTKDVERYVEGCNMCQRMKNRTEVPAGKLKLSEMPKRLWTYLIVDFIMKLLVIAGKDAILVVCNKLSKMTYFVATIEGRRDINRRISKIVQG